MARVLATDITPPRRVDSLIFDVDGVLWDTSGSYDPAIVQTIDLLAEHMGRGDLSGKVGAPDLRAMRLAGGLNSDWDLTYVVLVALLAGWKDLGAAATATRGRGRAWAEEQRGFGANLEFELLRYWFDLVYWGSERIGGVLDTPPVHGADLPGTWHAERPLVTASLLDCLRHLGIDAMGIATGRPLIELQTVLDNGPLLDYIDFDCMCRGDILKKPDPAVVSWCVDRMRSRLPAQRGRDLTILYSGDTRDDLDLVLNYNRWDAREPSEALWIGAVSVVPESEFGLFLEAGAAACIDHVSELPAVIQEFQVRTGTLHE